MHHDIPHDTAHPHGTAHTLYRVLLPGTHTPVEDLIRSQFQSEAEFTDQCFSHFKLLIAVDFKLLFAKDLAQALACRLEQL